MSKLCLVLGDQLSMSLSSIQSINKKNDVILMAEVMDEATYVKHHKQKIIFVFSAMRHFAQELQQQGYTVHYTKLDAKHNTGSLYGEVNRHVKTKKITEIVVTEAGEYRLTSDMQAWHQRLNLPVQILEDDRFIASHDEFKHWAKGRKELIMEYFYREMRKKTGLLMNNGKPEGDQWNLDKQNRKPPKKSLQIAPHLSFKPDKITQEVIELVKQHFSNHFGDADSFQFATTRTEALEALEHFCHQKLHHFGDYQDAMLSDEPFMFHSILSPYINAGLLLPHETCQRVMQEYTAKRAPLNAVEGFIRQIIGWREYIRGIYWLHMPEYIKKNALGTQRNLPNFYWNADTPMHCVSQVVNMTQQYAYSHHIQRLMVTGNFALLAGLNVHQVHEWYLAVYADAYEWVELPNTLGMSLFGDGGIVGTKPYISSGAYINRMSNFCQNCKYNVKKRTGEDACPFNFLYWDFLMRHEQKFKSNRRMSLAYRNLERLDKAERAKINAQAKKFLNALNKEKYDKPSE